MDAQELLARPAEGRSERDHKSLSTVKSVLVHVQNDGSVRKRIEDALAISRASSAHVTCLHVTPIEAYVAFDGFGGVFVMNDVMKAIEDEGVRLRQEVEEELRNEDLSWDYVEVTGNVATEIISYASLADVVITGREARTEQFGAPAISLIGDLLQRSRTPLFIPGDRPLDPNGAAIVAWDGSYEAANALRASVGLLKLASSVRVVSVRRQEEQDDTLPGTRPLEYLARHGISAELIVETSPAAADDDFVAATLIGHTRGQGGYVVMGGYGHSRVRQFLFGGVTRTMLSETTVPVLIAR